MAHNCTAPCTGPCQIIWEAHGHISKHISSARRSRKETQHRHWPEQQSVANHGPAKCVEESLVEENGVNVRKKPGESEKKEGKGIARPGDLRQAPEFPLGRPGGPGSGLCRGSPVSSAPDARDRLRDASRSASLVRESGHPLRPAGRRPTQARGATPTGGGPGWGRGCPPAAAPPPAGGPRASRGPEPRPPPLPRPPQAPGPAAPPGRRPPRPPLQLAVRPARARRRALIG
ncbi:proline-rich protein 2-like [Lontra canadensis]|uniref:proline-rich protein 2-like n=1 Tax=Lontra canadensis TaxID=76717 RepID=UPI0013F2E6D1|nr:proline-rich protein 2-like [Lontra canadensis]